MKRRDKMPDLATDVGPSFLAALDASPALIWLSDANLDGAYFNRAWTEFTGRATEEEVARGWMTGVHPEDLDRIAAYGSALQSRQPFEAEYRLRRHDGAWRWMLDTGRPMVDAAGAFIGYIGCCIDITARREAEEALSRSDERLLLAQEAAGIGTYDWDVQTGLISWSPEMFRLYGIDPQTPSEEVYAAWLARVHPEDRDRADAESRAFFEAAGPFRIEFRILHPGTGERWIQGRGRMRRDAAGLPVRMIGANFDVTERRRAVETLRESEQRLHDIADNFPGIIFRRITHPDGRVEYPFLSKSDDAVFSVARERFEGVRTLEAMTRLAHESDVAEIMARYEAAAATLTPLEIEGRLIGEDGEATWIRSISRPRRRADGALIWDGVMLDVTEQHRRTAERDRAATMLRMSMEVAGVGTWEYHPEGQMVQGSPFTNRAFGLPEDDTARPLADYLKAVHPEDAGRVAEGIAAGARARAGTSRDYRLLGPEGTLRWVSSRGAFVRLADGTERIIGALTDVTAQKRQQAEREAALRRQNDLLKELNHRVKNNLQLILALMRMQQKRGGGDTLPAGIVGQIETIADLHGRLSFVTAAGQIDFAAHLHETLGRSGDGGAAGAVDLCCDPGGCMIDLDRAVPLAVVVHDLVAGARRAAGPVRVTLTRGGEGDCSVTVAPAAAGVAAGGGENGDTATGCPAAAAAGATRTADGPGRGDADGPRSAKDASGTGPKGGTGPSVRASGGAGLADDGATDMRFIQGLCAQIGAQLDRVGAGGYRVTLRDTEGAR